MHYDVFYKRNPDGRAPEYAFLDEDYDHAGAMDADNPKDLAFKIRTTDVTDSDLVGHRALQVGDVISDEREESFVFTPMHIWAKVTAFSSAAEIASESATLDT